MYFFCLICFIVILKKNRVSHYGELRAPIFHASLRQQHQSLFGHVRLSHVHRTHWQIAVLAEMTNMLTPPPPDDEWETCIIRKSDFSLAENDRTQLLAHPRRLYFSLWLSDTTRTAFFIEPISKEDHRQTWRIAVDANIAMLTQSSLFLTPCNKLDCPSTCDWRLALSEFFCLPLVALPESTKDVMSEANKYVIKKFCCAKANE